MKGNKVNINTFRTHLFNLLPMRNPSRMRDTDVERYCVSVLTNLGRQPDVDKHGNILSISGPRAICAHTDSVDQSTGRDREPIYIKNGIIRTKYGKRPIGGDDKVGIAIALTIAAAHPGISVCLFADEEAGCIGSSKVSFRTPLELAVQCDRRGANDVVYRTSWTPLASLSAQSAIEYILPHREPTVGGLTDVVELSVNGQCENAINLSCGYYQPHSNEEYIVLSHAIQALLDAEAVLLEFPQGVEPVECNYGYYSDSADWYSYGQSGKVDYSTVRNWEQWEVIQACEEGPFGPDHALWVENGDGSYSNIETNATIPAEIVQAYLDCLSVYESRRG